MVSLKYDNERLQQLIQQKGINPSAILNQQNASSSEPRLSLGDPAGLGMSAICCIGFLIFRTVITLLDFFMSYIVFMLCHTV